MPPHRGTTPRARTLPASLRFLLSLLLLLTCAACERDASGPEIAGFDEDELQAILDDAVASLGIPGAVVSVTSASGETWTGASGVSDLAKQTPMQTTNRFRIGSLTKTFTAIVTLQLVDEGKLSLNDRLSKWFPTFPAADSVTVRMLLNHTGGIPNYLYADTVQQALITSLRQPWTPEQQVAIAAGMPRQPLGTWYYSNTNYILLGMIIGTVTGSTVQAQIQSRIIDRLGLTHTTFATDTTTPPDFVTAYCDWGSQLNYTVAGLNASLAGAAGALISTVDDVTRWGQAFASGEMISPAMFQQQLVTVPTPYGPSANYGLGTVVSDGWVGHKGDIFGFNSVMYAKQGVGTIVVITNKFPNTQEPAPDIFRAFSGRLFNSYPIVNRAPLPAAGGSASRAPAGAPGGLPSAVASDTLNVCTTSTGI